MTISLNEQALSAGMTLSQQFCKDIAKLSNAEFRPSEVFLELTRRLNRYYSITRGALILKNGDHLTAVSTWRHGIGADGLGVNLPNNASLFEKVVEGGQTYSESFVGAFSGNFFERKLLLDETTQAFVLQPLKVGGEVIGLIGFSSADPDAFALFEDGVLDEVADSLAARIVHHLSE